MTETRDNHFADYARAYCIATRRLIDLEKDNEHGFWFVIAPIFHNTGICAELTFKAILYEEGRTEKEIRAFGHDLVRLLRDVFRHVHPFDLELRTSIRLWEKSISPNKQILQIIENDPTGGIQRWQKFSQQVVNLNQNYFEDESTGDRFLTRYPPEKPHGSLCDPWILLEGLELLLEKLEGEEWRYPVI